MRRHGIEQENPGERIDRLIVEGVRRHLGPGVAFHHLQYSSIGLYSRGEDVPEYTTFPIRETDVDGHLHFLPKVGDIIEVGGRRIKVTLAKVENMFVQQRQGPPGVYFQGTPVENK